jgi:hypothetical protein
VAPVSACSQAFSAVGSSAHSHFFASAVLVCSASTFPSDQLSGRVHTWQCPRDHLQVTCASWCAAINVYAMSCRAMYQGLVCHSRHAQQVHLHPEHTDYTLCRLASLMTAHSSAAHEPIQPCSSLIYRAHALLSVCADNWMSCRRTCRVQHSVCWLHSASMTWHHQHA